MSDQLFNILPLSLPTQMPGSAQLGQISTSGAAPAGFSFTSLLAPQAAPAASLPWSADGQSLPLPGEALPPANSAAGQPLPQLLAGLDAPVDGSELSPGQLQAL